MTALADRPMTPSMEPTKPPSDSDRRLNQALIRVLSSHIAPTHLGFVLASLRASITAHLLSEASARTTAAADDENTPSPRELQVLRGMSLGKSNGRISRELYLSEDTVKTHARRLFRKLGVRDRAHAVNVGWERGLLGPAQ